MKLELLKQQYDNNLSRYQSFISHFKRECTSLLEQSDISYYELSFRIKTWESILEKIERNNLSPKNISDIHDILGFRIIVLYKRDIEKICTILKREFQVLYFDDKSQSQEVDVFGYLSVHLEVSFQSKWFEIPSVSELRSIQAEIQVRTFSQHIWAASSHLLQYKIETTIPATMRRNIYRLAAVLEIVDNELESILDFRDEYHEQLRFASQRNGTSLPPDQPLDSIILENILDQFFWAENKKPSEPFDLLLTELFDFHITTVGQLQSLLTSKINLIKAKEEKQRQKQNKPFFYTFAGLLRIALYDADSLRRRHTNKNI